ERRFLLRRKTYSE
ncbi:hypothetical protein CP08DC60_0116B, partial [Chlamydia psittaci 08DC60]